MPHALLGMGFQSVLGVGHADALLIDQVFHQTPNSVYHVPSELTAIVSLSYPYLVILRVLLHGGTVFADGRAGICWVVRSA